MPKLEELIVSANEWLRGTSMGVTEAMKPAFHDVYSFVTTNYMELSLAVAVGVVVFATFKTNSIKRKLNTLRTKFAK